MKSGISAAMFEQVYEVIRNANKVQLKNLMLLP